MKSINSLMTGNLIKATLSYCPKMRKIVKCPLVVKQTIDLESNSLRTKEVNSIKKNSQKN